MNSSVYSKKGYHFRLTEEGKKVGKVRAKYDKNQPHYTTAYEHTVPKSWVEKGWVVEEEDK